MTEWENRPDVVGNEETAGNDEMFEHFRILVDKGQEPLRVDKFIASHQEDTSRHRVQQAIKLGYVLVNDKPVKANYIVRPLDVVKFVMPYERRGTEILPENIPLDIVYEDDDVLVVNKPAGMVVHPGHGNYNGTLVNALAWYLHLSPDVEDERMGVLVHRIDKDTSGLLVVAKNPAAQLNLADQFFVHSIDYLVIIIFSVQSKQKKSTFANFKHKNRDIPEGMPL